MRHQSDLGAAGAPYFGPRPPHPFHSKMTIWWSRGLLNQSRGGRIQYLSPTLTPADASF